MEAIEMNRKISVLVVLLLSLFMSTVMLAQAVPLKEKNNEKFQTYTVASTFNLLQNIFVNYPNDLTLRADYNYIPSLDNCQKLTISYDEIFSACLITIDGTHTYVMGQDFEYTGHVIWTFIKPEFNSPLGVLYPSGSSNANHMVDYTYDFSAFPGGIEGTLNMRAVFNPSGGIAIYSLSGTGDLQNVQIKAAQTGTDVSGGGLVLTVHHGGYVFGWPE
jgi:hypothetical protein